MCTKLETHQSHVSSLNITESTFRMYMYNGVWSDDRADHPLMLTLHIFTSRREKHSPHYPYPIRREQGKVISEGSMLIRFMDIFYLQNQVCVD